MKRARGGCAVRQDWRHRPGFDGRHAGWPDTFSPSQGSCTVKIGSFPLRLVTVTETEPPLAPSSQHDRNSSFHGKPFHLSRQRESIQGGPPSQWTDFLSPKFSSFDNIPCRYPHIAGLSKVPQGTLPVGNGFLNEG
jgi:hypothetical protein